MKRSISVNNSTLFLQKTLRKRKTTKNQPKTGDIAISCGIEKKDVGEGVDASACSTRNENGKTFMRTLNKKMPFLCSIYDIDFRNLERSTNFVQENS